MGGSTDLAEMLATLTVEARPEPYTFVSGEWPSLAEVAAARVLEDEGPTYVVTVEACCAAGAPVGFEAGWLTVTVHSSLEAVGLTAALSRVLADAQIPCNVLAAFHHDHLLVPWGRVDAALAALHSLRDGTG